MPSELYELHGFPVTGPIYSPLVPISVELVPHGRPAAERLADLLRELRDGDPLAPATVVVPRSFVGLSIRRLLASGRLHAHEAGRPGRGIANVRFTTLPRLAGDLGAPRLSAAGNEPLTDVVLRAAVRAALADDPGVLDAVREHQATEDALADAWRALRDASPAALDRIAARGARQADLVRLCRDISSRLRNHIDDPQLIDAAIDQLVADPGTGRVLGPIVVHLVDRITPHDDRLIRALAATTTVVVMLGVTGDAHADADVVALAGRLGWSAAPGEPRHPLTGTAALSAPSADVEVLLTLRDVSRRVLEGTPLDRIAITYGPSAPYALRVRDACAQAGLHVVAPSGRRLSQTLPGRSLLGALELAQAGWRRDEVVSWLATAPAIHDGREVRAAMVDRLSRRAGIVAGLDQWLARLAALADEAMAEMRLAEPDASLDEARVAHLRRRVEQAGTVTAFLTSLADRVEPSPVPTTWSGWADWGQRLLGSLLGGPGHRGTWAREEQEAFEQIARSLGDLSELDGLDPHPDQARFLRTLRAQLDVPAPQTARFGDGIVVGPYRSVVGLDLDVVYVLGVIDGAVPPRVPDDALLPDTDRAATGGEVALLAERSAEQRRIWLAALAAAPDRVLSFARGEQRTGGVQRPARWFLDTVGALTGADRELYARDLERLDSGAGLITVASEVSAVRSDDHGEPVDGDDFDLRLLAVTAAQGARVDSHWLADEHPALRTGWDMRRTRRVGKYDRFEGRVRLGVLPSPVDATLISPTTLQNYAVCPRRYLLKHLLGIAVPDTPGEVLEAEPMTVGSILHRVMELFIKEMIAGAPSRRVDPDHAWSDSDHARLQEVATQVFTEFEQQGVTGHPVLWGVRSAGIRRDLRTLLDADTARRARQRSVPERVELKFGIDDTPPAEVSLSDGRTARFRGYIDRVDRAGERGAVVLDYKTGSSWGAKDLETDPVKRGQLLQLAVYGIAARNALDVDEVESAYWYTSQKGGFKLIGYPLDDARLDRFGQVVEALVTGIERGDFPARPVDAGGRKSETVCTFCDFTEVCPSNRDATWARVATRRELAGLVSVIDRPWPPPAESDDDGEGTP